MIRYALIFSAAVLSACGTTPGGVYPGYQPAPGQGVYPAGVPRGQYVVPQYLRPEPTRSPRLLPRYMRSANIWPGSVYIHRQ